MTGSVYWKLSKHEINAILEEEDNERMFLKQLMVPSFLDDGVDVIFHISVSRKGDMLSFYVKTAADAHVFMASIYCECMTNGRQCKQLYDSRQRDEVVMDVMNMKHYEEQNLMAFEAAFLSLNNDLRNSAKYFQIPTVVNDEDLEFMFHAEILAPHHRMNVNECIKYKWSGIEVPECALFDGFEIYSRPFGGNDSVQYDDCWCLVAQYCEEKSVYTLSLHLVKLSLDISGLKV